MRRASAPRLLTAPRHRLSAALLAVVVLPLLTAFSCNEEKSPISLASAEVKPVSEVVDASATVTARAAATLTAAADGTLAKLLVAPGQQVQAGQVVAVVDSPSAQDRLKKARTALSAARRAGGGVGKIDLGGGRRSTDKAAEEAFAAAKAAANQIADPTLRAALLKQVETAQRQYASAIRAVDQATRAVERGVAGVGSAVGALSAAQRLQAQQAYDLAKATVDALTLRAPIAGVVQLGGTAAAAPGGDLSSLLGAAGAAGVDVSALGGGAPAGPPAGVDATVPVGGLVSAGTAVLTVVDTGELGLLAEVDETDVLLVKPGLAATVELDAVTGSSYEATVRSVDVLPTAAAKGGVSYRVRLALGAGKYASGEDAPRPRPGMNALVHLRVREVADAVAVPATAVFSADGRDTVWLVRDGKADRVPVTLGVQGADLVQILDGVHAGDRIVIGGTDKVRDGQQVGD